MASFLNNIADWGKEHLMAPFGDLLMPATLLAGGAGLAAGGSLLGGLGAGAGAIDAGAGAAGGLGAGGSTGALGIGNTIGAGAGTAGGLTGLAIPGGSGTFPMASMNIPAGAEGMTMPGSLGITGSGGLVPNAASNLGGFPSAMNMMSGSAARSASPFIDAGAGALGGLGASPSTAMSPSMLPSILQKPASFLQNNWKWLTPAAGMGLDFLTKGYQINKQKKDYDEYAKNYLQAFDENTNWQDDDRDAMMRALMGVYAEQSGAEKRKLATNAAAGGRSGGSYESKIRDIEMSSLENAARSLGGTYGPSGQAPNMAAYFNPAGGRSAGAETMQDALNIGGQSLAMYFLNNFLKG